MATIIPILPSIVAPPVPKEPITIVTGPAGSGKTVRAAAWAKEWEKQGYHIVFLAPTGRAARVLSMKAGKDASTVHSHIYTLQSEELDEKDDSLKTRFTLKWNESPQKTIYIVDEASMVSDIESQDPYLVFGSGRLLMDIIRHAELWKEAGKPLSSRKVVFFGDPYQLPPVYSPISPALSEAYIRKAYELAVKTITLSTVHRQKADSLVFKNATLIRETMKGNGLALAGLTCDESFVAEKQFVGSQYQSHLHIMDPRRIICVAHSNKQVIAYNLAIRSMLHGDPYCYMRRGDRVVVVNNSPRNAVYNGDLGSLTHAEEQHEDRILFMKGVPRPIELRFRKAKVLWDADKDSEEKEVMLLETPAWSNASCLPKYVGAALAVDFKKRTGLKYPKRSLRKEDPAAYEREKQAYLDALHADPYVNAIWVKFGFALTCHRAQGGEWDVVAVDFNFLGKNDYEHLRWMYTAITRARRKVIALNVPFSLLPEDVPSSPNGSVVIT